MVLGERPRSTVSQVMKSSAGSERICGSESEPMVTGMGMGVGTQTGPDQGLRRRRSVRSRPITVLPSMISPRSIIASASVRGIR